MASPLQRPIWPAKIKASKYLDVQHNTLYLLGERPALQRNVLSVARSERQSGRLVNFALRPWNSPSTTGRGSGGSFAVDPVKVDAVGRTRFVRHNGIEVQRKQQFHEFRSMRPDR